MPNWCYNELSLKKTDSKTLSKVVNKDGEVDFNILSPMPKSIKNTEAGSSNDRDIYVYLSKKLTRTPRETLTAIRRKADAGLFSEKSLENLIYLDTKIRQFFNGNPERHVPGTSYKESIPDTLDLAYAAGENLVKNKRKYGVATWYDWSCRYWGVKWNACDSDVGDNGYIRFDTPWGPPMGWLAMLATETDFDLLWEEESGYGGAVYGRDGDLTEGEYPTEHRDVILDVENGDTGALLQIEESCSYELGEISKRGNKARFFYSLTDLMTEYPDIFGKDIPEEPEYEMDRAVKEGYIKKYSEKTGLVAALTDGCEIYLVEVPV